MRKILISLLFLKVISSQVYGAGPALSVHLSETVRVSDNRIKFSFVVENTGDAAFKGPVIFKPILIPTDRELLNRNHRDGVVLKSSGSEISLNQGRTLQLRYEEALPPLNSGSYLLGGVIVDPAGNLPEAGQTPDLRVVLISSSIEDTMPAPAFDLFSDVSNIDISQGRADNPWRLFLRGKAPSLDGLTVSFLFADVTSRKLYQGHYDKRVGWTHMGDDWVGGQLLPYDVYHNMPVFDSTPAVPAGDHYLLTLVNVTDAVQEAKYWNNLGMDKIETHLLKAQWTENSFFEFSPGEHKLALKDLTLSSDYPRLVSWRVDPKSVPAWLTILPSSGTIDQTQSDPTIHLVVNPEQFAAETQISSSFVIEAKLGDDLKENIVIDVNIQDHDLKPLDVVIPNAIAFSSKATDIPGPEFLKIENPSDKDLYWKIDSLPYWVSNLSQGRGVVKAKAVAKVLLFADPRALALGDTDGEIGLFTNEGGRKIAVKLTRVNP